MHGEDLVEQRRFATSTAFHFASLRGAGGEARKPAPPATVHGDVFDSDLLVGGSNAFRVALLIPMCGSAGIWGPSCIASAEVAAYEINRRNGIAGRNVRLILVDSAVEASTPVEDLVDGLVESRSIDAIVGMHISAVRQRLAKVVRGRVPFVYTPMYEGGEHSFGVFAIGDTPGHQLVPAMDWIRREYRLRKWALIGNDYVWPRASNRYAKSWLADMNASLLYERYIPFSTPDMAVEVEAIEKSGAEAVLISLIGQDAVDFNRIFGHMGLDRGILRLTCVIEENCLLASGAENLKRLFCASSYFGVLHGESPAPCAGEARRLRIFTHGTCGIKCRPFGLAGCVCGIGVAVARRRIRHVRGR